MAITVVSRPSTTNLLSSLYDLRYVLTSNTSGALVRLNVTGTMGGVAIDVDFDRAENAGGQYIFNLARVVDQALQSQRMDEQTGIVADNTYLLSTVTVKGYEVTLDANGDEVVGSVQFTDTLDITRTTLDTPEDFVNTPSTSLDPNGFLRVIDGATHKSGVVAVSFYASGFSDPDARIRIGYDGSNFEYTAFSAGIQHYTALVNIPLKQAAYGEFSTVDVTLLKDTTPTEIGQDVAGISLSVNNDCIKDGVNLVWLNQKGGYESVTLTGNMSIEDEDAPQTYTESDGEGLLGFRTRTLTKGTKRTYTARTPLLKEADADKYQDIFRSPDVYIAEPDTSDNNLTPIIILGSSRFVKDRPNGKHVFFEVQYQVAKREALL